MEYKKISEFIPNIKDYYYITSDGEIYTTKANKFMKTRNKSGSEYQIINLMTIDGKKKTFRVHRLVMICFNYVENYKELEVNHINGIKTDNTLKNLEWCTSSENQKHAFKNGLQKPIRGEQSNLTKLTKEKVKKIKKLYNTTNLTQEEIGKRFSVTKSNVSSIVRGKSWEEITFND